MRRSIFLLFLLLLIIGSVSTVSAFNGDITYSNSTADTKAVSQSFSDLQNIIDVSGSGNVIYLNGTTFSADSNDSSISINKDLTINGAFEYSNFVKATIDGNGLIGILTLSNNCKVTLININFINGYSNETGGVISTGSYSSVNLLDCNFINNSAVISGGVLRAERGAIVSVTSCNFINNSAVGTGGVMSIGYGAQIDILNSIFVNNTSKSPVDGGGVICGGTQSKIRIIGSTFRSNVANYEGGVVYSDSSSLLSVYNCLFMDNRANLSSGGAISSSNSKITIENSKFKRNSAKYNGGAVYANSNSNLNVTCSIFEDNIVERYGGAIYAASSLIIYNSNFTNNTSNNSVTGDGGTIYGLSDMTINKCNFINNADGKCRIIFGVLDITIINSNFINSISSSNGGVIYGISGLISVINSSFVNTSSRGDGGAIYGDQNIYIINSSFVNTSSRGDGGAIYGNLGIQIYNSKFINSNSMSSGGAIYGWSKIELLDSIFTNCAVNNDGGAVYVASKIIVNNSNFIKNSANSKGGAIFADNLLNSEISNSNFIMNSAIDGAAIYCKNNLTLINSTFTGNNGTNGVLNVINANVSKSKFINNKANDGGAIFTNSHLNVYNSIFENNVAVNGGALSGLNSASINIINSNFKNNSANVGGAINNGSNLVISNSQFVDNSANIGCSIYANGNLTLSNSVFNDKNTDGLAVIYINSSGKASLTMNTISSNVIPIFNEGTIISPTTLSFFDASSWANVNVNLFAILNDDNGNVIGSSRDVLAKVDNQNVIYVFDNKTEGFVANFTPTNIGIYNITGSCAGCVNPIVNRGVLKVYIETELIVDDLVKYFHNGSDLEFRLVDGFGNPIAGETVLININGATYARVTDSDGYGRMSIELSSKNYTVSLVFEGGDLFGPTNKTINITVLPIIISHNLIKYFQNDSHFHVILIDGNGNPIEGATVEFNVNGVFYYKTTNASGVATLKIYLNPGKYIITSIFRGCLVSNNITVLSTIISNDLVKYCYNDSHFVVRVLDKRGYVIGGKNVTFNINGVFYNRVTDENGVAVLNIYLNPGEYIITTMADGLFVSNTINVLTTIISDDLVMSRYSRVPYKVTVLDNVGRPAAGKNVTFNINGVVYHRISDANGVASIDIYLINGKYIITTYYEGLMQSNTVTIT